MATSCRIKTKVLTGREEKNDLVGEKVNFSQSQIKGRKAATKVVCITEGPNPKGPYRRLYVCSASKNVVCVVKQVCDTFMLLLGWCLFRSQCERPASTPEALAASKTVWGQGEAGGTGVGLIGSFDH